MAHINRREILAAAGAVAGAFMFARTGSAAPFTPSATDGSLARISSAGTISFGTSNDVPYAFLDPQTQKVSGIDADILAEILKRLDINQTKTVQVTFSGLVPGLLSRHFDVIADSMWITDKRKQQIDFSVPWYKYGETIVVAKGNPKGIKTFDDLKGLRVGAEVGTVYVDWVNALGSSTISTYSERADAFQDLVLGRIDALVVDAPVGAATLVQQPPLGAKLDLVSGYASREEGRVGAGFRKEDIALREGFDWAFGEMQKDGTDLAILKKWGLGENNQVKA